MLGSILYGNGDNDIVSEDNATKVYETEKITETERVLESDAYGWTIGDYTEFHVALKTIANQYLTNFKMPSIDKWYFMKFDDTRIIATTDEFIFKNDNEKHTVLCVFSLSGDVDKNGFHNEIKWSFFGTDEKVYYDDHSCDTVFEIMKSLVK